MPRSNLSLENWCYNNDCLDLLNHLVNKEDRNISYASHIKVEWVCDLGHKFSIDPCKFTNPHRCQGNLGIFKCPYCNGQKVKIGFNDLATTRPDLASEWDYDKNSLSPKDVTKGSHKEVWWKCANGHSWKARISARDYRNGCPYCANRTRTSKPEQILYLYIKKYFPDALNMYSIDGVSLDIYIPSIKVAVEYDGSYWHSDKDTSYKFKHCSDRGITLYKISGVEPDSDNVFYIDDNNLNLSVFPNRLTFVIQKLFSKVFRVNIDFSDYNEQYLKAISLYTNKSCIEITDEMRRYWSPLNGYDIEYISNDSTDKIWRCNKGHTFYRRYDVMKKSQECPLCRRLGNFTYYIIAFNNIECIIYDKSEYTIESISYEDLLKAVDLGINISGVVKTGNGLKFDFTQVVQASNSSVRYIFEPFYSYEFKSISNSEFCTFIYNWIDSFSNKYSLQSFVNYIKEKGYIYG